MLPNTAKSHKLIQFSIDTFCSYPDIPRPVALLVTSAFILDLFAQIQSSKIQQRKLTNRWDYILNFNLEFNEICWDAKNNATIYDDLKLTDSLLKYKGQAIQSVSEAMGYVFYTKTNPITEKSILMAPSHFYMILQKLSPKTILGGAVSTENNFNLIFATAALIQTLYNKRSHLTIKRGNRYGFDKMTLTLPNDVFSNLMLILTKNPTKNELTLRHPYNNIIQTLLTPPPSYIRGRIRQRTNETFETHHLFLGTIAIVGTTFSALSGGVLMGNKKVVYYATQALRMEVAAYLGIGVSRTVYAYWKS